MIQHPCKLRNEILQQGKSLQNIMTKTSDKHTYDRIHFEIHNKLKWEVNEILKDEPYKVSLDNGYTFTAIFDYLESVVNLDTYKAKQIADMMEICYA